MTTNYLLKMKPENDYVGSYLNEIKIFYYKMKEETVNYLTETSIDVNENHIQLNKNVSTINNLLNQQNELLMQLIYLNSKITNTLNCICNHEWFTDSIDLDLDRSKTIEYCKICGTTK